MNAMFESPKSVSSVNTSLWAAVSVLGVTVLAMGATLVHIQIRPAEEPCLAVLSASASAARETVGATPAPLPVSALPSESGKVSMQKRL